MSATSRRMEWCATLVLLLCGALAGCAGTPLTQRDWLALRSEHYDFWSALEGSESARVANDLERFRAGAEFIWGRKIPTAPIRTQVFAFDDRGVRRAFAHGSERGYLLPRQRGDLIVLRAGGGWEGDAWTQLKLEYARRLFWNASAEPLPPWFEEGVPQLASTLEVRGEDVIVGALRKDHIRTLRGSQWIPFQRLLAASDLVGWSSLEREVFEAESWALCHYLVLSDARRGSSSGAFERFRALLAEGSTPLEAARAAFGDEKTLERAVSQYVRADTLDRLTIPILTLGPALVSRPVPKQEILEELGALAQAIGENELAERLLERAIVQDAGSARALAALGAALEAQGDAEAADARFQAALAAAPDDAIVQLDFAQLLLSRAAASAGPARRAEHGARAREHFQRAASLDPDLPEAHAGLAASRLLEGEATPGLAAARMARNLLPGDTEIAMLEARSAFAAGDRETARREAALALSRARSRTDLDAAQLLLEQIDERTAIR